MTITEFLEARIAEDEAVASECLLPEHLHPYGDERIPAIAPSEWGDLARNYLGGPMGEQCARHDPARVLAECEAKRVIIQSYEPFTFVSADESDVGTRLVASGIAYGIELAMKFLAAAYADHPDYRHKWPRD